MQAYTIYKHLPVSIQDWLVGLYSYKLEKERYNKDYYKIYDFLLQTEIWSKQQILNYKEENLFKIIEHAYKHCPYYYKKFSNLGLSPSSFTSLKDLDKFPILTKDEVRQHWKEMLADNINKKDLIASHTSGTSGKALDFYWTKHSLQYYWAIVSRFHHRFGVGGV